MRLLSDFDGVWTHPREEGLAQGVVLDEMLLQWTPEPERPTAQAWIAAARRAVLLEPSRYGWAPGGGSLSCFADEDPFAEHSALLHYIHLKQGSDPIAARWVKAVEAHGYAGLDEFGGWSHRTAVRVLQRARGPAILPSAWQAGLKMLLAGIDTVVVSNSHTGKLKDWFGPTPLPTFEERAGAIAPANTLRLRGNALKFVLDEPANSKPLAAGPIVVETSRPKYEAVLRAELERYDGPRAVVGDLFSIDLALPLRLRRTEAAFADVRLFWIVRDYTPVRIQQALAAHAPEIEAVAGLEEVAARLLER